MNQNAIPKSNFKEQTGVTKAIFSTRNFREECGKSYTNLWTVTNAKARLFSEQGEPKVEFSLKSLCLGQYFGVFQNGIRNMRKVHSGFAAQCKHLNQSLNPVPNVMVQNRVNTFSSPCIAKNGDSVFEEMNQVKPNLTEKTYCQCSISEGQALFGFELAPLALLKHYGHGIDCSVCTTDGYGKAIQMCSLAITCHDKCSQLSPSDNVVSSSDDNDIQACMTVLIDIRSQQQLQMAVFGDDDEVISSSL